MFFVDGENILSTKYLLFSNKPLNKTIQTMKTKIFTLLIGFTFILTFGAKSQENNASADTIQIKTVTTADTSQVVVTPYEVKSLTYQINDSQISFQDKLRPCLSSNLDPKPRDVENSWQSYLKGTYKIKLKGGTFMSAEDVIIPSVSPNRMNLYTRVAKSVAGSEMSLFASFGYDFFIGTDNYPKEFVELKKIMDKFLYQFLNKYYADEINSISKDIKSLEKRKISLLKLIESNSKKVEKATREMKTINNSYSSVDQIPIKEMQKLTKQKKLITSAENSTEKSKNEIVDIDEKVALANQNLEKLKVKQKGLLK